jgi:hypothetical protein
MKTIRKVISVMALSLGLVGTSYAGFVEGYVQSGEGSPLASGVASPTASATVVQRAEFIDGGVGDYILNQGPEGNYQLSTSFTNLDVSGSVDAGSYNYLVELVGGTGFSLITFSW